ncbi:MAG: hypothetical protein BWY78_00496 [Alphaproteobacteria bacterium ADurb.Bin438]|nr:MAG: hypothetical protein BWY78_00496 [Alphaproteobacteria bacterium ADurb.Bin438]
MWERSKVIKLLDSIYKEYPIGSFFIWEADKKYNLFYRNVAELNLPQPDAYTSIRYILDGQQRATSLYVAIKGLKIDGADYSQICFDFDKEVFIVRHHEGDYYAALKDILGENKFQIYNKLTDQRKRAFDKCYNIFSSYPLSVITVREKDLDEASEIFERINQGGKRLSIFDLVVASTWGEDFDLKEEYSKLYEFLVDKGFGKIPPEVVTHAASLIVKGYCRNSYQLQLTKEELKENWEEISNAIKLSIDFLTNNLGTKIYEFVPYPSIIALLAYLYFKAPGRSLTKQMTEKVHEWFWKSALSERYAASRETRMEEDRRLLFDKLLEGENVKIGYPINLDEEKIIKSKISNKSALRNAFFCMLAIRHPRHFKTNNMFALDYSLCSDFNSPEKHHIFPRHFLRKNKFDGEYSLANFCFIPAELNKEILDKSPSDYFAEYEKENPDFKDALEAQLIIYDDSIKNNSYKEFLKTRAKAIFNEFQRLLGSKILQIAGSNMNKALDEIELLLRSLIDKTLLEKIGKDYWSTSIPSDIKIKVQEKGKEHLKKNPSKTWLDLSTEDSLGFCDIMDYSNIILKHWQLFEETFRSKFEVEKRFVAFKDFRNAVKHNREINAVLQRDGEAALEWFSQALKSIKKQVIDENDISSGHSITPCEPEEDTIARVKSEFVKKAVRSIPDWVEKEYKNSRVNITGGVSSYRYLKQGDELMLFYYYANNWVYGELQFTTTEEMKLLKEKLSDPTSIFDRHASRGQVRFHLLNEADLEVIKDIIRSRVK